MEKDYEVEVVHRQRAIYRVRANDREAAEEAAAERWREGDPSDVPGFDWCEMVSAAGRPAAERERLEQDAEVVYRFLQARERLIQQLGGDPFNPTANDAISAAQVASDLGWTRADHGRSPVADVSRATAALEGLCRERRVVCFVRPRQRGTERGEIRLYCTPQYLERLSEGLTTAHADRS